MNNYKIVKVKWIDSYYCCKEWTPMEGVLKDIKPDYIFTVGFLIKETEKVICVVADIDDIESDKHNVSGGSVIPKQSIIEIVNLIEEL